MTMNIAGPIPHPRFPISGVTPFTYRDGWTYLEVLENFRTWIRDELVPLVNDNMLTMEQAHAAAVDAFNETLSANETFKAEVLSNLIGYTIEVDDETYRASMMDGSIFEAFTIQGVNNAIADALAPVQQQITTISNDVDDHQTTVATQFTQVGTEIDAVANDVSALDAQLTQHKTDTAQALNTVSSEIAEVDARRSGLLRATIEHKFHDGTLPYTVVTIENNASNDVGSHVALKLSTKGSATGELLTLDTFAQQSGADIVANATATNSERGVSGILIEDGVVVLGWLTGPGIAGEAIARMNDGTFQLYKAADGHTPQSMLTDGVIDAWGFGPIIVEDGELRNIIGLPNTSPTFSETVSARTIYGWNANGDFMIISVGGNSTGGIGLSGNQMGQLALAEGATNALVDDGGGSTQLYANGKYERMSSDTGGKRPRRAVVEVHDIVSNTTGSKWQDLELINGFTNRYADEPAQIAMDDETYQVRGVLLTPTLTPGQTEIAANVPLNLPAPRNYRDAATFGHNATEMARARISANSISISPPSADTGNQLPRSVSLGPLTGSTV